MIDLGPQTRFGLAFLGVAATVSLTTNAAWALETFSLENVVVVNGDAKTTIPTAEFVGTNLTKDQAQRLLAPGSTPDQMTATLQTFVASRVTVPQIVFSNKDGQLIVTGFQVTDVKAGSVGHFSLTGIDGSPAPSVKIKSGPFAMDGVGVTGIVSAMTSGDLGSATSHFGHISWQGLTLEVPDSGTPAAPQGVYKIALGSLSVDATADGDVPLKAVGKIENFVVEPPATSQPGQGLASLGLQNVNIGLNFATSYDPVQKTLAVDDFAIRGVNIGSLGFKLLLTGIDKGAFVGTSNARMGAVMGGGLSRVELSFADAGIAAKALAFAAQSQGTTPEALKTQYAAMATQMIPAVLGGHPDSLKIAEQVSKFIADPKALTISARAKAGTLPIADLANVQDPTALLNQVDLVVSTATTPVSLPGQAPAAAAPSAPPAQTQAAVASPVRPATPAPASRRLTGLAAWNALVGNSISGKNDDGEPFVEYYQRNGTVNQLDDDDTQTGKWVVRGEQVCLDYDGDETCYKVVVDGTTATFTDEDGTGKRYEILQGNAKKL